MVLMYNDEEDERDEQDTEMIEGRNCVNNNTNPHLLANGPYEASEFH